MIGRDIIEPMNDCRLTHAFCMMVITFFFVCLSANMEAQTYTVNSLLDTPDANPGDGVCDDGSGNCTWRAAVEEYFGSGATNITFSVSGTIVVTGAWIASFLDGVLIEGNGIIIDQAGLNFGLSSTLRIGDGSTIQNVNVINSLQVGINVGGDNTTVQNCVMENCGANGLVVNGLNVLVQNCQIFNSGSHGVRLTNGDCLFTNNEVYNNGEFGVRVQSASGTISNNEIYGNSDSGVLLGSNITVSNNDINNNAQWGIELGFGANDNVFSQNSINCNTNTGIRVNGNNNNQPTPLIDYATTNVVQISNCSPGDVVEVFSNPNNCTDCEGEVYLGLASDNGNGTFTYSGVLAVGDLITTTSTTGTNSSEFSACAIVTDPCSSPHVLTPTTIQVSNSNDIGAGSLRAAIDCVNADPTLDNIVFDPLNAPYNICPMSPLPMITDLNVVLDGGNITTLNIQCGGSPWLLQSTSNTTIQNIILDNPTVNGFGGIEFSGANSVLQNVTFNNFLTSVNYLPGADFGNVQNCMIDGFVAPNSLGIDGDAVSNMFISGNTMMNCGSAVGLGDNSTVTMNTMQMCDQGVTAVGANSTISNNTMSNGDSGVTVFGAGATGNFITNNSIFCNTSDGIVLFAGGNASMPAPIISSASLTDVSGTTSALAGVEVFINDDTGCVGDPCQGKTFVGTVFADAAGEWSLTGLALNSGDEVTATATDGSNNTSEFSTCATVCSHPDLAEMVNFYNSTNGGSWTNNTGWIDGAAGTNCDPCDGSWYGVTCNVSGRVVCIDLDGDVNCNLDMVAGNNLTGTLPDINLPFLTGLYLGSNDITGSIPDFSLLPQLKSLDLNRNLFVGGIPDFSSIPLIERIILSRNDLSGSLPSLTSCPNLINLQLDVNNITGSLVNYNLVNLDTLFINFNLLTNTIPDFNLPSARHIDIGNNNLSGSIPDFSNLGNLSIISLSSNNLTGVIPDFSNLPSLTRFYVSDNNLTGAIPNFTSSPLLDYLIVAQNNLEGCYPTYICTLTQFSSLTNPLLPWEGDHTNFCLGQPELAAPCDNGITGDNPDQIDITCACVGSCTDIGGGTVEVTNTADSGPGSLRSAIECANADPTLDNIHFNISGFTPPATISVLSPLPDLLDDGIIIDGTSQVGWVPGSIVIDGTAAGSTGGLASNALNAGIFGLKIQNFQNSAILIGADNNTIGSVLKPNVLIACSEGVLLANTWNGNTVEGNFIGVEEDGITIQSNVIGVSNISTATVINANVIGGNTQHGILLSQNNNASVTNNSIGLSSDGTSPISNNNGIKITNTSSFNTIGGIGQGNIIAYNTNGISNDPGSSNNVYQQNSMFCNDPIAIDNSGANGPAAPIITAADLSSVSGTTTIGSTVELFINDEAGCAGAPCQGKTFLGSFVADLAGNWTYSGGGYGVGDALTATATLSGTSEFSTCMIVADPCGAPFVINPTTIEVQNTNDSGPGSLRAAIDCVNADPTLDNIVFNISGAGPHTIFPVTAYTDIIDDDVSIDGGTLGQIRLSGGTTVLNCIDIASSNVQILNMEFDAFDNSALRTIPVSSINLTVSNCRFFNAVNNSIVLGGNNNTISQCLFDGGNTAVGYQGSQGNNISMNIFQNLISGIGTTTAGLNEVFDNNTFTNLTGRGIDLNSDVGTIITNSTFQNCQVGIELFAVTNIQVGNNDFLNNVFGIDFLVAAGLNCTIGVGNLFNGNTTALRIGDMNTGIFVSENSFSCNSTAIELQGSANASMIPPSITSANLTSVSGTANPGETIQVYISDTACPDCQGETFLGTTTADGAGNWTLSGLALSTGDEVTATATDASNNTSEFSTCAIVCSTPANDVCAGALDASLMPPAGGYDFSCATPDPTAICTSNPSLWFEYTTGNNNTVQMAASTLAGNFSVEIYQDCVSLSSLVYTSCNAPSLVDACLNPNTQYFIQLIADGTNFVEFQVTGETSTGACCNASQEPTANSLSIQICTDEQTMYDLTQHNVDVNATETVTWFDGDPLAGGTAIANPNAADMTSITVLYAQVTNSLMCFNNVMHSFTFVTAPDAGMDVTIDLCTSDPSIDLITVLGGTPDPGGTWTGPSTLIGGDQGTFNPAVNTPGVYNYFLTGTPPCGDVLSAVTVNLNTAVDAGGDGTLQICEGEPALQDLFAALVGTPQTGGTWNDLDGSGVNLTNPNAVDFSSTFPGIYTYEYTLLGMGACPNESANISVIIENSPDAGINGTINLCEGDNTIQDLFAALNGTPDLGGTWIDLDATGVNLTDPTMVQFTSIPPGTYNYEYIVTGTPPCTVDNAIVEVVITEFLFAGIGIPQIICEGETNLIDIFGNLNGADPGGVWVDVDGAGVDLTDPTAIDFSLVTPGPYSFTYTHNNTLPCLPSTVTQFVTVQDALSAGLSSTLTICEGDATLQDLLGALLGSPDPGGIWTESSTSGVDLTNPNAVDFSGVLAGTYVFLYNQTNLVPCSNEMSILSVNVLTDVDAGGDGSLDYCENDPAPVDLYSVLTGTPNLGGTWVDLDGSGVDLTDPTVVDFTGLTPFSYQFSYTIMGSGSCPTATSTATITILNTQEAGDNATLDICEGDMTLVDINLLLGPDSETGGDWEDTDGTGINLSNPTAVNFSSLNFGTYTFDYIFDAIPPCNGDMATLTVNVEELPSAGMDGSVTICEGETQFVDLFATINGAITATNGTWTELTSSGVNISNPYVVSFSTVVPGTYNFQYEVSGVQCPSSTSTVSVVIEPLFNNPGSANQSLCFGTTAPVDLESFFPGIVDPGGQWTDPNGSGVDFSNPNAVDFSTVVPGGYNLIYTLSNAGPCPDVSGTITINVDPIPEIVFSGSSSFCPGGTTTISPGGDPITMSYNWEDEFSNPVAHVDGQITVGIEGDYFVTITDANNCTNSDVITITESPDLTVVIVGDDICDSNPVTLDAGPGFDTYNWFDGLGAPLGNSQTIDVSVGDTYSVEVSANGCMGMDDIVITAFDSPSVSVATPQPVCNGSGGSTFLNFTNLLTGDLSGSWNDDEGTGVDLSTPTAVDFNNIPAGMYDFTYTTASANPPCTEAEETITVIVQDCNCPTAITNVPFELCTSQGVIDLTDFEDPTNDPGFWEIDNVLVPGNMIDLATLSPGSHNFNFLLNTPVLNCPLGVLTPVNIVVQPVVEIQEAAIVGNDAAGICPTVLNFNDFVLSGDLSGTWLDIDGAGVDISDPSNVDFLNIPFGSYDFQYMISAASPCVDVDGIITITVDDCDCPVIITLEIPDVCTSSSIINLMDYVDPLSAAGDWYFSDNTLVPSNLIDPLAFGATTLNLEYRLTNPVVGCPDVSPQSLSIIEQPNAGEVTAIPVYCMDNTDVLNLADFVENEDIGGSWTELSSIPSDPGLFDANAGTLNLNGLTPNIYQFEYRVTGSAPCTDEFVVFEIEKRSALNVEILQTGDECSINPIILSTAEFFDIYNWSNNSMANQIDVTNPGNYSLTVTDMDGCTASDELDVDFELTPFVQDDEMLIFNLEESFIDVLSNDDVSLLDAWTMEIVIDPLNGVASITADNQIRYEVTNAASNSDQLVYQLCNENCPDLCMQGTLFINFDEDTVGPTILLTPDNEDGVNDVAVLLDDIESYPENRIVVFNEWGNLVYDKEGYQNDWAGTGPKGTRLPQGTYYYYLRFFKDDINEIYGMIVILK